MKRGVDMNKFTIPEGARDFIFEECDKKEALLSKSKEILTNFNYKEIITPTIEFYKTFDIEESGLIEEDIYKFFDNNGRILVLRPDMTVPIARVVSTKLKDMELPLRVRYNSNVFRVNESFGGKRNEYSDCGVELIGVDEENGDLETLIVSLELLKGLEIEDFKIEIGNINLFKEATKDLDISKEEKKILGEFIEKKSLKALEDYLKTLNITEIQEKFFLKLPWLFGDRAVLTEGKSVAFNEGIIKALNKLEDIYEKIDQLGYKKLVSFDLGMVPRLNYYTGIIFRGYASGSGTPVLSGGRYDNLFSNYGENLKAIGFSVNLDLLINITKLKKNVKKVYNIYYNKENIIGAFQKAKELRDKGMIVNLKDTDAVKEIIIEKREEE